jgi:hypothetical protein
MAARTTIIWGSVVVVVILIILVATAARKDTLVVSPRARQITREARELFQSSGKDPRYRAYKRAVTGADPVQFDEVDTLYRSGNLSAEEVQKMLNRA